jgi:hypothetical protein
MPTFGDLGGRNLEGRPIEPEPGLPSTIRIVDDLVRLEPGAMAFETRREVRIEAAEPLAYTDLDKLCYVPLNDFRVYVESTIVITCKSADQANKVANQAMKMKGS